MVRPPNDGVHLEAPQAQTGSSSEGVRSATSGDTPCAASPAEKSIPGPTSIDDTKEAELASEQPVSAARSAGATTSGSKAVNEDSEDMRGLTDGRFSIRAEAVVDTKDLRELTGNRHRPDPEHERHLRERGDADTLATHLLGRDDTQSAPNPQRNAFEAGVPGVLLRPDQPSGTSGNRLTTHPETVNDETRPPELAHWAPVQDPEEDPGVTIGAPGHHIFPVTPGGNSEAGEVTVLAKSSALEALGQVQLQSPAAAAPPATAPEELRGELNRQFDDSGLDGHHSARLLPRPDNGEATLSTNEGSLGNSMASKTGSHASGHGDGRVLADPEQHGNSAKNVKNVVMSGGNGLLAPPSNGNDNGINSGDGDCNGNDPDHLHRSHLGHDNAPHGRRGHGSASVSTDAKMGQSALPPAEGLQEPARSTIPALHTGPGPKAVTTSRGSTSTSSSPSTVGVQATMAPTTAPQAVRHQRDFTIQSTSTGQTHCNELQDATAGNHGEFGEPEAITSLAKPLSPPEPTSEAARKGISALRASISDAHVEQCTGQSATPNLETPPTSPTVSGDPLAPTPVAVKSTEHDQAILTIDLTSPEGPNDGHHGALAKNTIPPVHDEGDHSPTPSTPAHQTLQPSSASPAGKDDTVWGPEAQVVVAVN